MFALLKFLSFPIRMIVMCNGLNDFGEREIFDQYISKIQQVPVPSSEYWYRYIIFMKQI